MLTPASSLFSSSTVPSSRTPSAKSSEKTRVRPTVATWPGRTAAYHRRRPKTLAIGWVREELCSGSANNWVITPWSVGCLALLSWWLRRSCRGAFTARYCKRSYKLVATDSQKQWKKVYSSFWHCTSHGQLIVDLWLVSVCYWSVHVKLWMCPL